MSEHDRRAGDLQGQAAEGPSQEPSATSSDARGQGAFPQRTMLGHVASQVGARSLQRRLQRRLAARLSPSAPPGTSSNEDDPVRVHAAAEHGLDGSAGPLPFWSEIQRSFCDHDLGAVVAHTGPEAAAGAVAMGAEAFATGEHVAFAGTPTLHTAAHEVAHVVQQRSGVHLEDGVGKSDDEHERNADAVADRVVRGQTASDLLPRTGAATAGAGPVQHKAVQRTRPAPLGPPTPKPELHTERFGGDKVFDGIRAGRVTLKAGEKSLQATNVQEALVDLGLLDAAKVSGTIDADTSAKLKSFQHQVTIAESGEVDTKTLAALEKGFDGFKPPREIALDPATEKDPLKGTRALSNDDRKAIDATLNPQVEMDTVVDPFTGAKTAVVKEPKFVDVVAGKSFEQRLREFLDHEITEEFDSMAKAKAADRADPSKMFEWSALEAIGAEAKREVDTVFGGYKMGPEVKKGTVLHDRWEEQAKNIGDAKAAGDTATLDGIAGWRIQKILNEAQGFKDVLKKHGAMSDRAPEKSTIDKVKVDLVKVRGADLLEIHMAWPGAASGGKIFLQRFKSGDAEADRLRLWRLFQTTIHEYLHTITSGTYAAYADGLGPPRDQTLREGVTDLLTKTVWSNVSLSASLRQKIEGPLYKPADRVSFPALHTYGETAQAEQLMSIVGARNLYAAYFLGKTELIGKK